MDKCKSGTITAQAKKEAYEQLRNFQTEIQYDTRDYTVEFLVAKFLRKQFFIPNYQSKFVWTQNGSYKQKASEIIDLILNDECIRLDRKAVKTGGNWEAEQIRIVCAKHGIQFVAPPESRGGNALLDVKNKRNQLAHGNISFS